MIMHLPYLMKKLKILSLLMRQNLLPILYPRHCPFCQKVLPYRQMICESCRRQLPLIHSPVCYRCGKPLNNPRQELCYDCRIFPKSFDQGLALFLYNSMTQPAVLGFKYHNQRYYADFFVHAICSMHILQIKHWHLQAIVPVPIHKNKRKKRGYNQAQLLAEQLALRCNLPTYPNLILRDIDTLPQKEFSPQARLSNLNRAFRLNPTYQSLLQHMDRILLIDDIYTTGATMESCCRLLKSAGVRHVYIYSLCIGVARDEILS